jgi:hypothetical protein
MFFLAPNSSLNQATLRKYTSDFLAIELVDEVVDWSLDGVLVEQRLEWDAGWLFDRDSG